jgi:peptidoglycan/LPS O-acetylase OafA/YrhL
MVLSVTLGEVAARGGYGSAPPAEPAGRRHLPQLDALRVITCFSVLTVHVLSITELGQSQANNLAQVVLHYSRFVFFTVSALVLAYTYLPKLDRAGRLSGARAFRRRRAAVIGLPYAVWTAVYVAHAGWGHWAGLPGQYLRALWVGDGKYHLYFLLVSLQFGLVFPLWLRFVVATRGWHLRLLLTSAGVQALTYAGYYYGHRPGGWLSPVAGDASLLAYQFWLLLGAVIALNLERVHEWLLARTRLVFAAAAASLGTAVGVFFLDEASGARPDDASVSLQPVTIGWAVAALGLLYLLADRVTSAGSPFVAAAVGPLARLSFGIYLVHPAVADFVDAHYRLVAPHLTEWELTGLTVLVTAAVTVPLVALMGRSPLSLALIGRPGLRVGRRRAGASSRPDRPAAAAGNRVRGPTGDGGQSPA